MQQTERRNESTNEPPSRPCAELGAFGRGKASSVYVSSSFVEDELGWLVLVARALTTCEGTTPAEQFKNHSGPGRCTVDAGGGARNKVLCSFCAAFLLGFSKHSPPQSVIVVVFHRSRRHTRSSHCEKKRLAASQALELEGNFQFLFVRSVGPACCYCYCTITNPNQRTAASSGICAFLVGSPVCCLRSL